MKNFLRLLLSLVLIFSYLSVNAVEITINDNKSITDQITNNNTKKYINYEDIFLYFAKFFEAETPESYTYIKYNYNGVEVGSDLEKALQILLYHNKIKNTTTKFDGQEKYFIKADLFYRVAAKILGVNYNENLKNLLGERYVEYDDLDIVEQSYIVIKNKDKVAKFEENIASGKKEIFENVLNILLNNHYNSAEFSKDELYYSAIQGLAKGTKDEYTVYFPPTESKDFQDSLSGDFEGIGAYVDLPEPGVFKLTSIIPGGPADKANLKGGDIVLAVDSKEIKEEHSQNEIVSWIRGVAGSEVILKIKRGNDVFDVKVIREKVHLKSIETKVDGNAFVITITGFNENVSAEFREAINTLKEQNNISKIIIDLRDNGGGYLDEVIRILGYFVEKGQPVVNVKYADSEGNYFSSGLNLLNPADYKFIFLQNENTASASEIMIGTMKDYFPNIVTIGEKTYGKGSVQQIKEYYDGSSLKFTNAKWFTGKTQTGIDGIGIFPDIEVILSENEDNQYKRAINY